MGSPSTAYDKLHFSSKPHPGRHPYRIGTIARLFGVRAAPTAHASILELGCGDGANLIAIASAYPEASIVGVDLSASQIESGRSLASRLGVDNVRLVAGGFDAIPDGEVYDYVLCHGVFSWVGRREQDTILRLCSERLASQGVASISYNTLPGWHIRGIVREMLAWRDDPGASPEARISRARETLSVFGEALGYERFYSLVIQAELDRLSREPDAYLFHEQLAPINEPMRIKDVVGRAETAGLRFLGDARFGKILHRRISDLDIPESAQAKILELTRGQPIELEQYLDYVVDTVFRETLFCRASAQIVPDGPERNAAGLLAASNLRPLEEQYDPRELELESPRGQALVVTDSIEQQALLSLTSRWPACVRVDSLTREVIERFGAEDPSRIASTVRAMLLRLFGRDAVDLYDEPPPFAVSVPERPYATPLARHQASRGGLVVNLRHETIFIGDLEREILAYCDGRNGCAEMVSALSAKAASGELVVSEGGEKLTDLGAQRESLEIAVSDALGTLVKAGLFVERGMERGAPRDPRSTESAKPSLVGRLKRALSIRRRGSDPDVSGA